MAEVRQEMELSLVLVRQNLIVLNNALMAELQKPMAHKTALVT